MRTALLSAAAVSNFSSARLFGDASTAAFSPQGPLQPFQYTKTRHFANQLIDFSSLRNDYYCLRHGQSEANVAQIIASSREVACEAYGLSALGHEQARAAGQDVLKAYGAQTDGEKSYAGICIISSDLLRAKQTAEAVATAIHLDNEIIDDSNPIVLHRNQVIIETRLRERGFGEWDLTSDSNYKEVWKEDAVDPTHEINGVESVASVMDRVSQCILEWEDKLQDHMVICVAHGDVLQILQTCFSKMDGSQHRSLEHLETATLRKMYIND